MIHILKATRIEPGINEVKKNLNSPIILGEKLLKAKFGVRATRYVAFFSLTGGEVTGWYFRSLLFIVFGLKLPSSTWVEALVPSEETQR